MVIDRFRGVAAAAVAVALFTLLPSCASKVVVGRSVSAAHVVQEEPARPAEEPKTEVQPETAPTPEPEPAVAVAEPEPEPEPEPAEEPPVAPRASRRAAPLEEGTPSPYELDLSYGGFGLSLGYFDTPVGIAVDEEENMYVVDQGNYRIQKFDRYGLFMFAWGRQGLGDAEFEVVDVAGTQTLRMTGIFEFSRPLGILLDRDDQRFLTRLTVVDSLNHRIQRFLVTRYQGDPFPDDVFVMLQGGGLVPDPDLKTLYETEGRQVILDPIYITEPKADSLLLVPFIWGGLGFTQGLMNNPSYLAKDEDDILFVTDTDNGRLQGFYQSPGSPSNDASFFREIGNNLDLPYGKGRLNSPTAVAFDNTGYGSFLVLDEQREGGYVIQRFDREGNFLGVFAEAGGGPGQLRRPVCMAVNPFDNTVFVTDAGHRKVMVYNTNGEFLFAFGGEELSDPRGIAVLRNGYVYVTDAAKNMVYRYIPR